MTQPASLKKAFFDALAAVPSYVAADGSILQSKVVHDAENLLPTILDVVFGSEALLTAFTVTHGSRLILDKAKLLRFLTSKDFLPDSYTAFANKIGLTSEGQFLSYNRDVVLDFPYKDAVLVGNQSHDEQKGVAEKFYNEVLASDEVDRLFEKKALCNFVRHSEAGSVPMEATDNFDPEKDNMIIRGNNLLVLHSLRQRYAEKVKLIYIDIPYNTGSDSFAYNDRFSRSTWLVFMKNRLQVAKDFLLKTGTIFIQVNDAHMAYLKVLCDEVFDEANLLNTIVVKTRDNAGVSGKDGTQGLRSNKEYIFMYAKNKIDVALNPLKIELDFEKILAEEGCDYRDVMLDHGNRELISDVTTAQSGTIRVYKHYGYKTGSVADLAKSENKSLYQVYRDHRSQIYQTTNAQSSIAKIVQEQTKSVSDTKLFSIDYVPSKGRSAGVPTTLYYSGNTRRIHAMFSNVSSDSGGRLTQTMSVSDFWEDIKYNGISSEGGITLKNGKKPEKLLQRIIAMGSNPGDLVLDFFLGSGTTAAVAHKMGRQYIGVEQMVYGSNSAEQRLRNVIDGDLSGVSTLLKPNWAGGGSFVSFELLSVTAPFVASVLSADEKTINEVATSVSNYAVYLDYRFNAKLLTSPDFDALTLEQKKNVLMKALDKNSLYVNYSDIEDSTLVLTETDKALTHKFYGEQ